MPGNPPRKTPGRDTTRPGGKREPRSASRPAGPASAKPVSGGGREADAAAVHAQARSRVISALALGVTYRLAVLGATLAVLMISFVSGYSVYLNQQRAIAEAKAEIAAHEAEIYRLNDELRRWQDPAYVRAQARDRLGWVLPGEVGYRVIDADGNVIGGTVDTINPDDSAATRVWYEALWLSIDAADRPVPRTSGSPSVLGPNGEPINPEPVDTDDPGQGDTSDSPVSGPRGHSRIPR